MGKLATSSSAGEGSNENKPLALSARKSSTNVAQLTNSYRQSSFNSLPLLRTSSSVDRALGAAAKRNALKRSPASLRNSIFVSSKAWQSASFMKKGDDSPPMQPRRSSVEIDEAPPCMPQRKASSGHLMMMHSVHVNQYEASNANIPTRKTSVQDCSNVNTLARQASNVNADTPYQQRCNDYCSSLANQRNAVFGVTHTKPPLRLSSFWDTVRGSTLTKDGGAAKQDKAPSSCQRKVSVSEISNLSGISLQSRNNLHSMSCSPKSVMISPTSSESSSSSSVLSTSTTPNPCNMEETWSCIQRDFYALVACQNCHTELTCIRNVAHVQCRQCHTLTANPHHDAGEDETIGIGLTLHDLRRLEEQQGTMST